jgi:PGF-CTERM protein
VSERTRSVLLTLLLVLSTFSTVGVGAATAMPTDSPTTYHVTQGDECYEVTAIGDGTTSVEDFYDYRAGNGTKYGSYGDKSQEIQENQVSHLFVYDGSQGTNLVMLHDKLNESEGGAITFDISGLPQDHQWVVEDDDYEGRDDNFNYDGTNATIDWMWAPNRTDGAAVRGLENNFSAITIDPAFGEESWAYQERDPRWTWATDNVSWELQSGDGTEIPLDKSASLSISKGKCPDETNPKAALTASPNPAANDESVTLNASNSTDNKGGTGIAEYRWDVDGDGTIDETTTDNATISHTYTSTGSYDASVTVVDGNGNADVANVTVEVTESGDDPPDNTDPTAALTAMPPSGSVETEFVFDANASEDDEGIAEYRWDLDGDGEYEKTTEKPTITHSFSDTGTYRVAVTVVDESGQTDTASESVTVSEQSSDSPPTADLQVESTVSMSQVVTFDASKSTDDKGIVKYKWDFDGDGEIDRKTDDPVVNHYANEVLGGPGTYEVKVIAVDGDYNGDAARRTVTVEKNDHTPPSAVVHVPETVEIGEELQVKATDLSEGPKQLSHICWLFETSDGMVEGENDLSASYTFEETGEKKVTLKLKDRAGNVEKITKTVTVTAADSGGSDHGDDSNSGDSNPDEGGISDGDDDGSKSDGLPSESPADTGGQQTGNDQNGDNGQTDETVSAPLNGSDGRVGSVVLHSADEDEPAVETTDAAPESVEAPAVEDDGFAALSYLTVSGADSATVTVSESRLDAADATPDDVTLFRHENGSWTAVETAQVEETDDGYRFSANVSEGTYAVGIDRPVTSVTDVSVGSQQADPGESVTVTVTVQNTGRADDTHEVILTVGSEEVSTKTVSVGAGETAEATFSVSVGSGGTYEVGAGDATAELVVQSDETTSPTETERTETTTATSDGGIPGFGVGVTLVALVAAALIALRRI